MNPEDSDPTGLNQAIEQETAILKRRWFRRLWWPFAVGLVAAAGWFLKWLWWGWVWK